jgi:uncharacterized membrane protein
MKILTRLSVLASVLLLLLLPLMFGQLMMGGLAKLHLGTATALTLMVAIIFGGLVNIPVKRIIREDRVAVHPLAVFGVSDLWPRLRRVRRETILAVNLGGCVIPSGLALYELLHLVAIGGYALLAAFIASAVNSGVCYVLARPTPGIGIVMPGLVPAFVSAGLALILAPDAAAPVAFIAGVAGPLLGADLLHLKEVKNIAVGVASIGGAGTFDGIVLSGIVAAYLT